ncbi:4-hydroxyphenylpyruvate dioxygenase [Kitasatospora sp. NPDC101447]|uniref:4-hydroxyphenylpyruvate dioxygenase n=1 Tax=Kitasatospora sp. NPDC101447 TaxID=3364102 RepID=UPI00380AB0C3
MNSHRSRNHFDDLTVDHVRLCVVDLDARTAEFVRGFGLTPADAADLPGEDRTAVLTRGEIRLVLSSPLNDEHPDADYTRRHGDGVSDIALGTADAAGAFAEAVRRGARPLAEPVRRGGVVTASVAGFGDVAHTFVQRAAARPSVDAAATDTGLRHVDHFAVCVEAGALDATVEFYQRVLDFRMIFEERVLVGSQAMNSKVVQSRSGLVTLTVIEPDTTRDPGQIDGFLKNHGGAGVQHVAFTTDDIVRSVTTMRSAGVAFLDTPDAYYGRLPERLALSRHSPEQLGELRILADEDHAGQLYQIFTQSTHPQRTLFFEVIERAGATTFGSGNIRALYEAVAAEEE